MTNEERQEFMAEAKRFAENDSAIKIATAIVSMRRKIAELDALVCSTFKELLADAEKLKRVQRDEAELDKLTKGNGYQ